MAEKETPLYNPHDGFRGRDGGPYLDIVERETAEIRRAKIEDREPDLEHPGLVAGTPAVVSAYITDNLPSNPGSSVLPGPGAVLDEFKDNPDKFVNPVQVVTQEVSDEEESQPTTSGAEEVKTPVADETESTPTTPESSGDTSVEPQDHVVNAAPGFEEPNAPKFPDTPKFGS